MDHILNEYSDILFTSSTWQSQTYRIDQVGEINYAGQILKLWIENHENITEMPVDFSRQIRLKCDLIRKGQLSPCAPDYQFCQTVTSSEFDKQRTKQTKAELLQLLKSVEESDMPQKKKERQNERKTE